MPGDRRCPECGASLGSADDTKTCEELFHAALAMEWTDPPRTYEAHHLLVVTYMLQHPSKLTPEAEEWYASTLVDVVDGGLSSQQLRGRHRGLLDQDKRSWNIGPDEPRPVVMCNWSATIADVIEGAAEELPERVWRWASTIRKDLSDRQR